MKFAIYGFEANPNVDPPFMWVKESEFKSRLENGSVWRIGLRAGQMIKTPRPCTLTATQFDIMTKSATAQTNPTAGVCEICGFNRTIEKAHIIPKRHDGPAVPQNLLDLCPNHHTLFDRDRLSWEEMSKIWSRVKAALIERASDDRLDSWRERLSARYPITL